MSEDDLASLLNIDTLAYGTDTLHSLLKRSSLPGKFQRQL